MKIAKALVATAVAGLGALSTALVDDRISQGEWVTVATAAVVALGAVWGIPNRQAGGR